MSQNLPTKEGMYMLIYQNIKAKLDSCEVHTTVVQYSAQDCIACIGFPDLGSELQNTKICDILLYPVL